MGYTLYLANKDTVDLKALHEKIAEKHTGWILVAEQEDLANEVDFVHKLKEHNKKTGENVTVISASVPTHPDLPRWSPDLMYEAERIVAIYPDGSARVTKDTRPTRVQL